jgi:hypothetical protein
MIFISPTGWYCAPTGKPVGSWLISFHVIARRASIVVTLMTPDDPVPRRGYTMRPVNPLRGIILIGLCYSLQYWNRYAVYWNRRIYPSEQQTQQAINKELFISVNKPLIMALILFKL